MNIVENEYCFVVENLFLKPLTPLKIAPIIFPKHPHFLFLNPINRLRNNTRINRSCDLSCFLSRQSRDTCPLTPSRRYPVLFTGWTSHGESGSGDEIFPLLVFCDLPCTLHKQMSLPAEEHFGFFRSGQFWNKFVYGIRQITNLSSVFFWECFFWRTIAKHAVRVNKIKTKYAEQFSSSNAENLEGSTK